MYVYLELLLLLLLLVVVVVFIIIIIIIIIITENSWESILTSLVPVLLDCTWTSSSEMMSPNISEMAMHSLIIQHIDCLITVQEHVLPPPPTLWYILHYPVIRPCVVCSESAKVANIKYEPLTFVNEQRRPRSDCASALSDLSLHWSHMS